MPSPFELSGPMIPPASGGKPKHIVLLLHGLGSDGNDLIGLAPHWARTLPDAMFISPNAPFPCDMGPHGYQWYSFADGSLEMRLAGVRAAATILDGFIDSLLERFTLADENLALVGFSQGSVMAMHTAPRRAKPIAGVVGYSGMLNGEAALAAEVKSRPPILLVHGTADTVLPFTAMAAAEKALKAAGIPVESHARPGLAHGIDEEGLRLGGSFLKRVLKA